MLSEVLTKIATLAALTPDEIAAHLCSSGIKGYMSDYDSCPLARYLSQDLDGHVQVTEHGLEVHDNTGMSPVLEIYWPRAENFVSFVKRFDNREYPLLIEAEGGDEYA